MQSDRELLEYAAKAAGIAIDKSETNGGGRGNTGFFELGAGKWYAKLDFHNGTHWSPLHDDGDALRLAVKLCMDIRFDSLPDGPIVKCAIPWVDAFDADYFLIEWLARDSPAATRRAIVRAAASLATPGSQT